MLQNTWKDSTYGISSLTDRRPVEASDDLVVLAAPDPQGKLLDLYLLPYVPTETFTGFVIQFLHCHITEANTSQ